MDQREAPSTPLIPHPQNDAAGGAEKSRDDELKAYTKLMDHLDDINARKRKLRRHASRGARLLILSGLVAALVCSVKVEPIVPRQLLRLPIWQWVAMAIMLFAVFSVVPVLTRLVSYPLERVFRTRKHWVYFLFRLKRGVDVTLWSCVVLFGWYTWFRRHLKHVHGDLSVIVCHQITRFLIAFCVGAVLWTLKTALYLKLEADLHYGQLFYRIRETLVFLNGYHLLLKRADHEAAEMPDFLEYDEEMSDDFDRYYEEGSKAWKVLLWTKYLARRKWKIWFGCTKKRGVGRGRIKCIWKDVLRMKRSGVPVWLLVRLSKEYLKEIKGLRAKLGADVDHFVSDDNQLLEKAKDLFKAIKACPKQQDIHHYDEINAGDLAKYDLTIQELGYLMDNTQPRAEVGRIMHQNTAIKVDTFLYWAVRMHKKCWGLERTLESSRSAFLKLNGMLSAFLLVLMVIIWLLLSKIVNTGQLALLFAPFLAASFMFENSSKNMLNGIIFAFAMHPFDVGDRVIIQDIQMRVKGVHILTSVFYKYDTGAEVIFPNSALATTKIVNLDITPDQSDKLDFVIDAKTPVEDIKDLVLKLQKLLDENLYYASGTKVVMNSQDPATPQELKMTIYFKYLVSYLTVEKKSTHKSHILSMIIKARKEMEDNKQEFPLDYKPYVLQLTTNKVKLSEVERFKRQIVNSVGETCASKVVMTDLSDDKNEIQMALYVRDTITGQAEKPDKMLTSSEIDEKDFFANLPFEEYDFWAVKVTKDGRPIYSKE